MGSAAASSRGERTMRMPLPPPPAERLEQHRVADTLRLGQRVGLIVDEPRARDRGQAVRRQQAADLLLGQANRSSTAAGGPMKVRPWARTASAKASSSERKPYPGWTASQPVIRAAEIRAGADR